MAISAAGGAELPGKRKCAAGSLSLPSLIFLAAALAAPSSAAVYKVGDSAGWTIIGNVNYSAWAASKIFRVGDTIVFEYNKQFHNVEEVSEADFKSCSAQSPKATYITGNDSISLKSAGQHFFLCGVPGHCAIGQKVDINVLGGASAPAPAGTAPSASPVPSSLPPTAPSPAAGGSAPPPQKIRAAPGTNPSASPGPSSSLPPTAPSPAAGGLAPAPQKSRAAPGTAPFASPGPSSSLSPTAPSPVDGGSVGTGAVGVGPSPQKSRAAPAASGDYVRGWAVALLAVAVGANLSR